MTRSRGGAASSRVEMDDELNKVVSGWVRTPLKVCALLILLGAAPCLAQDAKLRFDSLDKLAAKADNVIDINVDDHRLPLIEKDLGNNPTEAKINAVNDRHTC